MVKLKLKIKKWSGANKDKIKEYYEINKEKINLKRKKKIRCACGSYIRRSDLRRHEKTKKHIRFIKAQINDLVNNFNNNLIF